jgi:hypothetical protein
MGHALMGTHYLTSLAVLNLGILALLWMPLEAPMRSMWLPLAMLPYLFLYTRDLIQLGYRVSDMFRVYALSLLLVPVHLGGVFKSITQIVTGVRTPFGRTPKVLDRTVVPLLYLAASYGFLFYCAGTMLLDIANDRWLHALFAGTNGSFLAYALFHFVGLPATFQDLRVGLKPLLGTSGLDRILLPGAKASTSRWVALDDCLPETTGKSKFRSQRTDVPFPGAREWASSHRSVPLVVDPLARNKTALPARIEEPS